MVVSNFSLKTISRIILHIWFLLRHIVVSVLKMPRKRWSRLLHASLFGIPTYTASSEMSLWMHIAPRADMYSMP